jgi:threonine dehydratase
VTARQRAAAAGEKSGAPRREPAIADIEHARQAIAGVVRPTPTVDSWTLAERTGMPIVLKAENLQSTGSFKLRGAVAKLASQSADDLAHGVICGSAGNHAQAVAYAARSRGVPCEVFMPDGASIAKVEASKALGAKVTLGGATVDEALAAAHAREAASGACFVHPFDDPEVIAGQGTIGLELLEQVPELGQVVVPIGGGGLISGIAIAIKTLRPDVRVVGVQVEACAPVLQSLAAGAPEPVDSARTIADGIAVKRPGELTLSLISKFVDEVVLVSEDQVAEAMAFLMSDAKLVVEGAGAVGVAALLAGKLAPSADPDRVTVPVLSGGNVDSGLLAEIERRNETLAGRRLVIQVKIADLPGRLASLLALIGNSGANLLDVVHLREGIELHIRETAVQLVLETRGSDHAEQVRRAIVDAGYEVMA